MAKTDITPELYREHMARFAGAVHIVTTDGAAGRRGVTIIAACSVSDDPPTVLLCLNRDNPANDAFKENGVFALNTLNQSQQSLSNVFAGLTDARQQDERFGFADWITGETGAPLLADAAVSFDCRVVHTHDHGTHRVLFGEVQGLRLASGSEPLIYYHRAYRGLAANDQAGGG